MLVVDRHQVLHRFGPTNETIRKVIRAFVQRGGVPKVRQYAQERCDEMALVVWGSDPGNPDNAGTPQRWLHVSSKPAFTPNPDLFPPSKSLIDDKRPAQLRYFYIQPGSKNVVDDDLPKKVIVGYTIGSDESMESQLVASPPPNNPESDLIFALIDDCGSSRDEVQKPMARMHKFGALSAGVPVVCAVRSHLKKLYDSQVEASVSYLSANLQAKIN